MSLRGPERVWFGDSMSAALARSLLAPAGWLYCTAASVRNRLYDAGILRSMEPALPTLSVGNLVVGGTGKTPVAAWAARRLHARGAHPAIVLRGYGDDEPLVHRKLNPFAHVIADADRVRAVQKAKAGGADCVILDDAYQHRRIRRRENWLLVAAEHWGSGTRCLPAGPFRESFASADRATVIIVTRKSASASAAREVAGQLASKAGGTPIAVVHLAPMAIVNALDEASVPLGALSAARVLAIAAVGDPAAFFAQLRGLGASVIEAAYRDHHAFDAREAAQLARRGATCDIVLCTLKDAVKLAPLWPRNGPALWYVSQDAGVEYGEAALDSSLTTILAGRSGVPPNAGTAGPDSPAHGYRSSTADQ